MANAGHEISYLKSTREEKTPDYLLELPSGKMIFEIGGRRKGREQFKGIKGGKPDCPCPYASAGKRLHLLGFIV